MFSVTRRWFKRNRTPLAIGLGIIGTGYVATQYVLGKINDARERMSSDRIAKENLRRRFEQNQEDCTFTVLALLPTTATHIIEALDTERITYEIQQIKGPAGASSGPAGRLRTAKSVSSLSPPTVSDMGLDDDKRSMISMRSESAVHVNMPTSSSALPESQQDSAAALPAPPAEQNKDEFTQLHVANEATATEASHNGALVMVPPTVEIPNTGAPPATAAATEQSSVLAVVQPAPVPNTLSQVKAPQEPRKTKKQLWHDLMISSITRAFALIYTLDLLTMFTRIQLNLLGRRSYLSSVVALATNTSQQTINLANHDHDSLDPVYGSDVEVNRQYLTFSWWLLNHGWADLVQRVEAAVRQIFGHLSPRDKMTFDEFSRLSQQARAIIQGDANAPQGADPDWLSILLPPAKMEEYVLTQSGVLDPDTAHDPATSNKSLRRLLDETSDLIESPAFRHVFTLLTDAGFSLLHQKVAQAAFGVPVPIPGTAAVGASDAVATAAPSKTGQPVLLPKILSVLSRQAHAIGSGMPNEYLDAMERVNDLEGFAAVVYSSNWESEVALDEDPEYDEQLAYKEKGSSSADSVDASQQSFEDAWAKALESTR